MVEIIKGDCYWADFKSYGLTEVTTDWVGVWELLEELNGVALESGTLSISADKKRLELRVEPDHTASLVVNTEYWIVVTITNAVLKYRRETQIPVLIVP
jgi:hypothetical protein